MNNFKKEYDEINIVDIILDLWNGKWKIIGVVIFSVLSLFGYQTIQSQPYFEATTLIKSINSVDAERYRQLNTLGFFEVTPDILLNLYIEQLDERVLFREAIRKYQLIDEKKYKDEQAYDKAVIALASSIKILPQIKELFPKFNVDGDVQTNVEGFWTISFEYDDAVKWKQVLSSVDSSANQSVKRTLQQNFQTSLSMLKQKRDFELEDVQTQIANAYIDYDKMALKRVLYLREQASIARKLGVAKNTIAAQTFSAQNGMVANFERDTPFYLRGYEAIEKEIELIEVRNQKKFFIEGLIVLEEMQRALEQDKTIKRADLLFAATPLMSTDDFSAVSVNVSATDIEDQTKSWILMLPAAIVLGGMVGVIYVLLSNAIRMRKENLAKT